MFEYLKFNIQGHKKKPKETETNLCQWKNLLQSFNKGH